MGWRHERQAKDMPDDGRNSEHCYRRRGVDKPDARSRHLGRGLGGDCYRLDMERD